MKQITDECLLNACPWRPIERSLSLSGNLTPRAEPRLRSLSHFEADTRLPHLINVDEDPFRHNRFIYLFRKPVTVFGPHGDVQPMSLR